MSGVTDTPRMSSIRDMSFLTDISYKLDLLIEGELVGRVRMNKAGRLSFDYEPRWRDSPDG
jgi:hypothetical protein